MKRSAAMATWLVAVMCVAACARDSEESLSSTFTAARSAVRRGELAEARTLAERGLSLAPPDSKWAWTFRLYRGEILLLQHQPDELPALVKAPIPAGADFDAVRARQKFLEARLQLTQNQLAEALATLEAAQRLAPQARDLQLDIAWLDGQLRMRRGKWAEGESRLNAVVAEAAAAHDEYQQARALNDLGMGGVVRGRWDEALPRFERVLSLTSLEQLTVYGEALNNAGICYARLGEFERAAAAQRRAIELNKGRGPRLNYAQALGSLGNTFLMQGDARGGLPFLREALSVAKASKLESAAAVWAGNVAAAAIDLGEWDEAARVNEEARALRVSTRTGNLFHTTLNAAQIAQGRGQLDEASRLFDDALRDGAADASVRWSAHWGLAEVALARSKPAEASSHFQLALDTIEKTRADLLKTDSKLSFLTRLIRFYQTYVDTLIDQGRIEQALEVSEGSRGRVLAEGNGAAPPAKVTAAALKQVAAASHAVLVAYWLAPARSSAWVVHPRGIEYVRLPPAEEIAALVREYQKTIDNTQADPLAASGHAGDRLYRMLVDPVRRWIPAGSRVVIAADGALHGLNFETLPVADATRRYVIADMEIVMTPGLSVLSRTASPSTGAASLLLLGDPAPRPPEYPSLRYAPAEIENVSKYFPADKVIHRGEGASPAAYRAATPQRFSFVHFTAHAFTNMNSPLDSAVILAGPEGAYKLYARDVASLPLTASLVTVSACRSAGERAYAGEGLVGFAWAFLRAGARRVIAGLWDVDDRSTAALMDQLYARITAGDTPSAALRQAKLSQIARGGSYAKPYYWGPFQLFTVAP